MDNNQLTNKQVVFFSHTAVDKDLVLEIKRIVETAVDDSVNIFMSSDGQSIPFGTNWVHKVEEGLANTALMFIMITENAVHSGWVYFEAGFAYSKGVKVVPVGLGYDISLLKSPLNLLQGFNVNSSDGLNNIISVINQEYKTNFQETFTQKDYEQVMRIIGSGSDQSFMFERIIDRAEFSIEAEIRYTDGHLEENDLAAYWDSIIRHLDTSATQYSIENESHKKRILVEGIVITWTIKEKKEQSRINQYDDSNISFSISPYSFSKSMCLAMEVLRLVGHGSHYIRMYFRDNIECIASSQDLSALLSKDADQFIPIKDSLGRYGYKNTGVSFVVHEAFTGIVPSERKYYTVLMIAFKDDPESVYNIMEMVRLLYDIGVIREKKLT